MVKMKLAVWPAYKLSATMDWCRKYELVMQAPMQVMNQGPEKILMDHYQFPFLANNCGSGFWLGSS